MKSFSARWDSTSLSRLGFIDSADASQVLYFGGNRRRWEVSPALHESSAPHHCKKQRRKGGPPPRLHISCLSGSLVAQCRPFPGRVLLSEQSTYEKTEDLGHECSPRDVSASAACHCRTFSLRVSAGERRGVPAETRSSGNPRTRRTHAWSAQAGC